jgi:biopolymer transport protein ExbD
MSAGVSSGDGGQDFELNLASIIDCFTVLISFMLVSASFISIGILDAGVAAAGASASDSAPPPPVNISIELKPGHAATLHVTGKETSNKEIPSAAGNWDEELLTKQLGAFKARWPQINAITLTAANTVEYKDVVHSMEVIRKTIPVVLLGGF